MTRICSRCTLLLSFILLLALPAEAGNKALEEYQRRCIAQVKKKSPKGLVQLSRWARKKGLYDEEQDALRRALALDARYKPARTLLDKIRSKEKHHSRYETPWRREANFVFVETNTSEGKLHYYCDTFTAFYNRFRKIFGVSVNPVKTWGSKIGVRIFATREDFERYQNEKGGSTGESTVGFYDPNRHELVLYEVPDDPKETLDTLFHEGTHLLQHLALGEKLGNLAPWMGEGIAEYFGPSYYDRDEKDIVYGLASPNRLDEWNRMRERGQLPSLRELVGIRRNRGFQTEHYSVSWALVKMLIDKRARSGKGKAIYRRKFVRCYELMAADKYDLAAFEKLFGPVDELEKEYQAYIEATFKRPKKPGKRGRR